MNCSLRYLLEPMKDRARLRAGAEIWSKSNRGLGLVLTLPFTVAEVGHLAISDLLVIPTFFRSFHTGVARCLGRLQDR